MSDKYNEEEKRNWLVPDYEPGDIQLGLSPTQEMATSPPASNTKSSVGTFIPVRRYVPGVSTFFFDYNHPLIYVYSD